ncbi:alpha/beta hydrolase [Halarchaeum nitratireducens]|uniref:alpha/beta hydrolase n=1 Tax=Halarchaeum nitratireducens TaxID=489913 RepID=UPI00166C99FC|nr:alpha/beta hydrolase [Halarchaeum nitratireducens]
MTDATVLVPGARRVVGTLDAPVEGSDACVVACPPHPRHGGHRGDARLRAVSDALAERGVACLRFDYGDWDRGRGEREDARNALRWARERYETLGLFGYSFGGGIAALAAASVDVPLRGVALLAPVAALDADDGDLDVPDAVTAIDVPLSLVVGTRDATADWRPVVAAAESAGASVTTLDADHAFAGATSEAVETIARFLANRLRA